MNNSSSTFLRHDMNDINDPSLTVHLKEIKETEETRSKCLETLRADLKRLKDIEPCLDEDFLLRFLRVSKYDTAKALQRILKYYQQFDVVSDVYKKFSFPLREAERLRTSAISPYRCRDNSFLLFGRPSIDYKKYNFGHFFYLATLALHKVMENPVNQVCGGTFVFDYEGMNFHGLLAFTPFWVRLFVDCLTNSMPCRLKAAHIVNMPSFFPLILKLVFPFLPKKLQNRVFFYAKKDDWKELHALIPPEILPEKYGGKLKEEELIEGLNDLKEDEEIFLRLFAFGNIKTKKARQSLKVFQ